MNYNRQQTFALQDKHKYTRTDVGPGEKEVRWVMIQSCLTVHLLGVERDAARATKDLRSILLLLRLILAPALIRDNDSWSFTEHGKLFCKI